ncbi:type II toxin-antitoxin system VapB family antitoxin [Geoglobus sp.]
MSTTTYSVRIPREVREAMERMGDVNWQEEIRRMIIERVREEAKRRLLDEAKELRSRMKSSEITKMIREDRDAR